MEESITITLTKIGDDPARPSYSIATKSTVPLENFAEHPIGALVGGLYKRADELVKALEGRKTIRLDQGDGHIQ